MAASFAEKGLTRTKSSPCIKALGSDTGGDAPHQKYRKRAKRTHPPGRCLSCDSSDTPEWRRGPDGPRTLCNACGLRKFERICFVFIIIFDMNNSFFYSSFLSFSFFDRLRKVDEASE
ncbi:hypothetical protein EDD21DRAFT_313521 [Dissophora ornata]|nr:hypothetical protein EDD21DRAFT_313521 [Dissophora ornata]